jgi:hypothetical protein
MSTPTNKDIFQVYTELKAFERKQPDGTLKGIVSRLCANLEIAAKNGPQPGFERVLAEQVAALERFR